MIHSLVLVLLFYFFAMLHGMWDLSSMTDQGSNPRSLQWKHRVLTPWPPGDFLGVDFQSRAISTCFRIWKWNQRSEKDPIAWAIHWMVGIFPVIGSLWGGRDLGEGLLTFEVLFFSPKWRCWRGCQVYALEVQGRVPENPQRWVPCQWGGSHSTWCRVLLG